MRELEHCSHAAETDQVRSGINVRGRFGKQDFRYAAEEDVYICPAGKKLKYRQSTVENGLVLRRYWTNVCQSCAIKNNAPPAKSGGSPDGSMSMFSKPCRRGSTNIRKRCANGVRRSSIPSARSRHGWRNPLPDEDPAARRQ